MKIKCIFGKHRNRRITSFVEETVIGITWTGGKQKDQTLRDEYELSYCYHCGTVTAEYIDR